jgi:predicted O-methyltransferase YrrM
MSLDTSINRLLMVTGYTLRQLLDGLRGRAFPIAHLHWTAWYESAEKRLPSSELDEIFPGIYKHRVELENAIPRGLGNVLVEELHMLALICRHRQPKTIFEFGTFNGKTAMNFALNTPGETTIYTLDLPPNTAVALPDHPTDKALHLDEKTGFMSSGYRNVKQLWSDSKLFDESGFVEQIELVFIDAAHSYEYVRNDTEKALKMVKPGGVILWHDYSAWFPGISKYLHELALEKPVTHIRGTQLAILMSPNSPK